MRQLQLLAHGELRMLLNSTRSPNRLLARQDVLISMEAAPLNPSDFVLVRGMYGVRPACPSRSVRRVLAESPNGLEGLIVLCQGKRVLILPTYEQGRGRPGCRPVRNIVPHERRGGSPATLDDWNISATGLSLAQRYVSLMPVTGSVRRQPIQPWDSTSLSWRSSQESKRLNVVARKEAAGQVRQFGGDRVVHQSGRLQKARESSRRSPPNWRLVRRPLSGGRTFSVLTPASFASLMTYCPMAELAAV